MTYKELGNLIIDLAKLYSDDSDITMEHVIGLAKPYRAMLLNQKYEERNTWKKPSDSNYQTIAVHLQNVSNMNLCGKPYLLRSVEEIPKKLDVGTATLFTSNIMDADVSVVSMSKLKFVGSNRYLKNHIYAAFDGNHLFVTSGDPTIQYLEQIGISGIFEDVEAAAELTVQMDGCMTELSSESKCDYWETEFPLEAELMPQLIDYLMKEIVGAAYKPEDYQNNANDDLSSIHSFIRQHMKNEFDKTLNGQ